MASLTKEMIKELNSLRDASGRLDTATVVAFAKNPATALHEHPAFVWDVEAAAQVQWHADARSIIEVWTKVIVDGRVPKVMRAVVSLVGEDRQRHYEPTETVVRENRLALINNVLDRIVSAVKSYPLEEFDPLLELVEEIRANSSNPKRAARRRAARKGVLEVRPRA